MQLSASFSRFFCLQVSGLMKFKVFPRAEDLFKLTTYYFSWLAQSMSSRMSSRSSSPKETNPSAPANVHAQPSTTSPNANAPPAITRGLRRCRLADNLLPPLREDASTTRNNASAEQGRVDRHIPNESFGQDLTECSEPNERIEQTDSRHGTTQPLSKSSRRGWNRPDLEKGGISPTLLSTLDNFTANIPPILNQVDHGKKTPNRDMRGWITSLQEPTYAPLWDSLINTLRSDSTAESYWGQMWDRHLCRYILGVVVPKEKSSPNLEGRSQTRQAVNNAIKRELECHYEPRKFQQRGGKSGRSKTFRDLFREKCRDAGVPVPPYEDSREPQTIIPQTLPPPLPPTLRSKTIHSSALAEPSSAIPRMDIFVHASSPSKNTALSSPEGIHRPYPDSNENLTEELPSLRAACQFSNEWGQTAWWNLRSDHHVRKLPYALLHNHLYELRSLLIDFRWIKRSFKCIDYSTGMHQPPTEGYDIMISALRKNDGKFSAVEVEGFRLIRNAVMLTLPIVKEDVAAKYKDVSFYAHLATQLTGRLLDLKRRFPNIACLLHSIEMYAPRPWLRPLSRCFLQPKTDIRLVVPSNGTFTPHLIVLSDDGKILVTSGTTRTQKDLPESGSRKVHMIRVWDVENGQCILENKKVQNFVRQLALNRDKSCISFETIGGLFFWHLRTSNGRTTIARVVEALSKATDVTSITPTAHADYVLTTHRWQEEENQSMMALWNTEGKLEKKYMSVKSNANCIDVSSDGNSFASGHDNGFIHLWSLTGDSDANPVLSFPNISNKTGAQSVIELGVANGVRDLPTRKTVSISYHEHNDRKLVAAISSDGKIRIWALPPKLNFEERNMKAFMSVLCIAVIRRPRTRQLQWAQKECFYTGGDDGMACEWKRCGSDWRWYAIEKNRGELTSEISASLISVGRNSDLVATYLTKSPYVTVWDTSRSRKENWKSLHERAYRSHCAMKGASVDVTDIQDLTALRKTLPNNDSGHERGTRMRTGMSAYGDNISEIRSELRNYFQSLDIKSRTRLLGEMQPRVVMEWGNENTKRTLEICFEQPVIHCASGTFITDENRAWDSGIVEASGENGEVLRMVGGGDGSGAESNDALDRAMDMRMVNGKGPVNIDLERQERRGMVAALQDGCVALFELEGYDVSDMNRNDIKGENIKLEEEAQIIGPPMAFDEEGANSGHATVPTNNVGNDLEGAVGDGGGNTGDATGLEDGEVVRQSKRRRLSDKNNGGTESGKTKNSNTPIK